MRHIGMIFFVFALCLQACSPETATTPGNGKLQVVATTGMVADLIRNIGGDSVEVTALMGPGVDPHLYKATQGDLSRLQAADLIFYNGLHLEGKMGEVFEKLARLKKVVAVAEGLAPSMLLNDPNFEEAPDPHIWFDVSLWAATIDQVQAALTGERPMLEAFFEANAANYRATLQALHLEVQSAIQEIPENQRILITAHDAFNYFGRAYGVEVRGLQGISTLSEFGLRDRVDLVNYIVEKGIKSVFIETSVSKKNIQSIVEGCAQKGHLVQIGGSLYSDAMGAAGTDAGTYVGMVRANVATIVAGLK